MGNTWIDYDLGKKSYFAKSLHGHSNQEEIYCGEDQLGINFNLTSDEFRATHVSLGLLTSLFLFVTIYGFINYYGLRE